MGTSCGLWVFWWQLYLVGLKNNWFHRVDEVFFFFSFTQISVDEVLSGAQLRPSCPSWSPENLNPPVVYSGCPAIILQGRASRLLNSGKECPTASKILCHVRFLSSLN
jgi:hypothetical protein